MRVIYLSPRIVKDLCVRDRFQIQQHSKFKEHQYGCAYVRIQIRIEINHNLKSWCWKIPPDSELEKVATRSGEMLMSGSYHASVIAGFCMSEKTPKCQRITHQHINHLSTI